MTAKKPPGTTRMDKAESLRRDVVILAEVMGKRGVTVQEFATGTEAAGIHHGRVSSAFSALHLTGRLARLTTKREGYSVYVVPERVGTRQVITHGRLVRERKAKELTEAVQAVERRLSIMSELPRGHILFQKEVTRMADAAYSLLETQQAQRRK